MTLVACGAQVKVDQPSRVRIDSDSAQIRVEKGEAVVERAGGRSRVEADQMLGLTGVSVVRRMPDITDDDLESWSQQRNRLIFLSLANERNILDPGAPGSGAGDADLNAWLGYLPPAAILPLSGNYASVYTPGYGYYPPLSTLAFYGPLYGGYAGGYLGGYRVYGGYGLTTSGYRPLPGLRFTPIYPTSPGYSGGFAPRPIGGIRMGVPAGTGISISRPVIGPRPVTRVPVRR